MEMDKARLLFIPGSNEINSIEPPFFRGMDIARF